MICEKCERIGRLNKIPHEVLGYEDDGDDEFVECPWDWEKEEIEEYLAKLFFMEIQKFRQENPEFLQPAASMTSEQAKELCNFYLKTVKKYEAIKKML